MKFLNFFYFCGSFLPSWIRFRIPIPNPHLLTWLNPYLKHWDRYNNKKLTFFDPAISHLTSQNTGRWLRYPEIQSLELDWRALRERWLYIINAYLSRSRSWSCPVRRPRKTWIWKQRIGYYFYHSPLGTVTVRLDAHQPHQPIWMSCTTLTWLIWYPASSTVLLHL